MSSYAPLWVNVNGVQFTPDLIDFNATTSYGSPVTSTSHAVSRSRRQMSSLARRAGERIAGAGDRDRHDYYYRHQCPFIGQIHNHQLTAPAPCPRRRPSPTSAHSAVHEFDRQSQHIVRRRPCCWARDQLRLHVVIRSRSSSIARQSLATTTERRG